MWSIPGERKVVLRIIKHPYWSYGNKSSFESHVDVNRPLEEFQLPSVTLAVTRYHRLWINALWCQAGARGYTPGFLSWRKIVMSLNFSGYRVMWLAHNMCFLGLLHRREGVMVAACGGGLCMGWVVLFATAEKFPELWRPELSPREKLCHLWLTHLSPPTADVAVPPLPLNLQQQEQKVGLVRQAHPSPAQPCVLIFLLPVTPHPWDSKVSFAHAAEKCQVALLDLVWPLPRAGLWLPLLN